MTSLNTNLIGLDYTQTDRERQRDIGLEISLEFQTAQILNDKLKQLFSNSSNLAITIQS